MHSRLGSKVGQPGAVGSLNILSLVVVRGLGSGFMVLGPGFKDLTGFIGFTGLMGFIGFIGLIGVRV